jgi:hypothetical protein
VSAPSRRILAPLAALGGFLGGLLAWNVIVAAMQAVRSDVPRSIVEARDMGLVSFTVLNGYDKGQELIAWLIGCVVVPISIWAVWTAVRPPPPLPRVGRRRRQERREEQAEPAEGEEKRDKTDRRGPPAWVPRLGLGVTMLAVALRPGFLRGPSPWGSFGLLGEEGVYLGAVQAIRTGRTLYVDLEFPYGPLLIHPLDWWLRIAGDTVVAARLWVLLLNLLGLAGAALTARLLVGEKRGPWVGLAVALSLAICAPLFLPNMNGVLLRPVLAFLPAALVFAAGRRAWFDRLDAGDDGEVRPPPKLRRSPLVSAGVLLVIGGMYSFEIGAAAVAGVLVAIWLGALRPRQLLRLALGFCVAATFVLVPLWANGSLGGLIGQARRMLTLPALGYQALPYPDPLSLFADGSGTFGNFPPETLAVMVWAVVPPLLIWLALGYGLCGPRRGRVATATGAMLLVGIISAVLFRAALGRSDLYHLWFYGAVPVVLITALLLERIWHAMVDEVRPIVPCVAALAVVTLAAMGAERQVRFPDAEEDRLAREAGIDDGLSTVRIGLPRAGPMKLLPRLAGQVEAITARATELPAAEGVWFHPSEATYYYLANRSLPMRYLWAYDAATPEMQDQAIDDLERTRPRWVFRSTDTFSIDHIPQSRLMPRIDTYLHQHYRPVELLPGAMLLERAAP